MAQLGSQEPHEVDGVKDGEFILFSAKVPFLNTEKLKKIENPQLKEQNILKSRSFICIKQFLKSGESQHIVIFQW